MEHSNGLVGCFGLNDDVGDFLCCFGLNDDFGDFLCCFGLNDGFGDFFFGADDFE